MHVGTALRGFVLVEREHVQIAPRTNGFPITHGRITGGVIPSYLVRCLHFSELTDRQRSGLSA